MAARYWQLISKETGLILYCLCVLSTFLTFLLEFSLCVGRSCVFCLAVCIETCFVFPLFSLHRLGLLGAMRFATLDRRLIDSTGGCCSFDRVESTARFHIRLFHFLCSLIYAND